MGNCTGLIKKKNVRPSGRANLVRLTLSNPYTAGGDTVPFSILGIGNRCSALMLGSSVLSPAGHTVEVVYGATDYVAPKLKVRDSVTGAEVGAIDLSGQTIVVEAIGSPYK